MTHSLRILGLICGIQQALEMCLSQGTNRYPEVSLWVSLISSLDAKMTASCISVTLNNLSNHYENAYIISEGFLLFHLIQCYL